MSRIEVINIDREKEYVMAIEGYKEKIKTLEAKVKRLQQSKLGKFAMAAMSGLLANTRTVSNGMINMTEVATTSIQQAKSLLDALEKEGNGEDELV